MEIKTIKINPPMNETFIKRANKIFIPDIYIKENYDENPARYIATFLKNIENLGFTFSRNVINRLSICHIGRIATVYEKILPVLKNMVGAHVEYTPMYPNFPQQVMEASDVELYINAILHYFGDWIGVRIIPKYEKEERPPLIEKTELRVIDLGTAEEFEEMFTNLMRSKTSISETDKKDLTDYFRNFRFHAKIPDEIPHKENLSLITSLALKYKVSADQLKKHYKSATDVLRLATAMSDGDVSLSDKTIYKHFSRYERRFLLSLIENSTADIAESMYPHFKKWIRLMEILHPGDYKDKYPKTFAAISKFRENEKVERFNSEIEYLLDNKIISDAISLLKTRPGIFARRMDHLLRIAKNDTIRETIVLTFSEVADKVSIPVLFQVRTHFANRDKLPIRMFMPKGNVAKMKVVENDLTPISGEIKVMVSNICEQAILNNFKKRSNLGKVWVDPKLRNFNIPFSQRSASESLRTLVRGSRSDFPDGSTLRFFIWWKGSRVDLDLSAIMLDENWNYKEHISYTNLRSAAYKAYHSGDITSAPVPASEFIDVDINSVLKHGGRYVIMSVNSYSGQLFNTMPNAFAGWMLRNDVQSGEIFEPKTVVDKYNLTADSRISVPMIFDLKERKMIWADMSLKSSNFRNNNIEGNYNATLLMARGITELPKATLYDLFTLHANARGEMVSKDELSIDHVFTVDNIAFEIEKIMGEYL
jgi:stress response protein SCP2